MLQYQVTVRTSHLKHEQVCPTSRFSDQILILTTFLFSSGSAVMPLCNETLELSTTIRETDHVLKKTDKMTPFKNG